MQPLRECNEPSPFYGFDNREPETQLTTTGLQAILSFHFQMKLSTAFHNIQFNLFKVTKLSAIFKKKTNMYIIINLIILKF